MINIVFISVCIFWIFFSHQVAYYAVIAATGFKIETPLFFMKYDYLCFTVSWLLFFVVIVLTFFQKILPFWFALVLIILIRSLIKALARKRGCVKYRKIIADMLEYAKRNGEDTSSFQESLNMTDNEILKEARMRVRL